MGHSCLRPKIVDGRLNYRGGPNLTNPLATRLTARGVNPRGAAPRTWTT
jgi:hypothetical protein